MLLRYLKSHWLGAALLALFSAVFALVFWLCKLPADAVGYALAICAAVGLIALALENPPESLVSR